MQKKFYSETENGDERCKKKKRSSNAKQKIKNYYN